MATRSPFADPPGFKRASKADDAAINLGEEIGIQPWILSLQHDAIAGALADSQKNVV